MKNASTLLAIVCLVGLASAPALAQDRVAQAERLPEGVTEKSATVNGVRINYRIGGSGPVRRALKKRAARDPMPIVRIQAVCLGGNDDGPQPPFQERQQDCLGASRRFATRR